MNEQEPRLELTPDQNTLKEAWGDVTEALVNYADTVSQPTYLSPVTPDAPRPYVFFQKLDESFVHEQLLDDKTHAITAAHAEYTMPHKMYDDSDEIVEAIDIRWAVHIPDTSISINHAITLLRSENGDDEHFEGYGWEEYLEEFADGGTKHISRPGIDFSRYDASNKTHFEVYSDMMNDHGADRRDMGIDEIEQIHKVAEYMRSKK